MAEDFRCIAIETATEQCSVAVANNDACTVIRLSSARESSREIYAAINRALSDAGLQLADVTCIAFGCGPGSFTGLRVAAGAAQALAYSRSLPVCRISTLGALALNGARKHGVVHVAACLDARMGEAYLGLYECESPELARPLLPDCLVAPGEIELEPPVGGLLAAGSGWSAWPESIERNSHSLAAVDPSIWPDAGAVASLARHEFAAGNAVAAHAAIPNYIREQVTT